MTVKPAQTASERLKDHVKMERSQSVPSRNEMETRAGRLNEQYLYMKSVIIEPE